MNDYEVIVYYLYCIIFAMLPSIYNLDIILEFLTLLKYLYIVFISLYILYTEKIMIFDM